MPALTAALRVVRQRYRQISFEQRGPGGSIAVLMQGGAPGLERVLLNVLVNACEGDGRRGATRVLVEIEPQSGQRVAISVMDDGPGFQEDAGAKPDGSGLGLGLVRGLVESGGGRVRLLNLDSGGAKVTLDLIEAPL